MYVNILFNKSKEVNSRDEKHVFLYTLQFKNIVIYIEYDTILIRGGVHMKKTLMIIGGAVVGIFILAAIIFYVVAANSEKLVCKSDEGNITIYYNEKSVTGYKSNGISYDLDAQKEVANQIGIDQYIEEFTEFFRTNTTGSCK